MSLWSLGPLLTRRWLSPGSGISCAQAKKTLAPAAGVPTRSLHSLRDLAVGDATGVYGGVAAAALAGLVGILYFRKSVTKEVTVGEKESEEVTKVVVAEEEETKEQLVGDEGRKRGVIVEAETKEHNDDFSLEEYLGEMMKIAAAQKKARYERSCKKSVKEVTNSEAVKNEASMKEEAAMKARFEEWIKEYGKRYKNNEEKARRYELFKDFANMVDKANAQGGAVFVTNHTADWTEEECQCLYDTDFDWDGYIDHIRSLIDKKNARAKKPSRD